MTTGNYIRGKKVPRKRKSHGRAKEACFSSPMERGKAERRNLNSLNLLQDVHMCFTAPSAFWHVGIRSHGARPMRMEIRVDSQAEWAQDGSENEDKESQMDFCSTH